MGTVSVRELLASLPGTPIYAGHGGLDKAIGTVSFLDAPSSVDWLNGGEVILTTAFLYKENTELQAKLVSKLIEMKAVALGIKMGRYIDELPPQVIALANEYDFPIFGINFDTVWSEIFTAFHRLHADERNSRSILSTEMISFNKLFLSSTWDTASIHAHFLKCIVVSAAITDDSYRILCHNNGPELDTLQNYCERRHERHIDSIPSRYISPAKNQLQVFEMALYNGERLVLCSTGGDSFLENELEWIKTLYGSIRNKNKFMQDTVGLWKNFLTECVIGDAGESIQDYARVLRCKDGQVNTVLLFTGKSPGKACDEFKELLRSDMTHKGAILREGMTGGTVVLLYGKENCTDHYIFLRDLRDALQKAAFKYSDFQVWVGEPTQELESLKKSYLQAQTAQSLGTLLLPEENIVFYRDFSALAILRDGQFDFSEISFLHKQVFTFDACRTLEIFLESGNIKRAAALSFVHDNTMRYRIQKLEQLLNMDLSKSINRINLLLKLKLWRIETESGTPSISATRRTPPG